MCGMAGELLFRTAHTSLLQSARADDSVEWEALFLGPAPWGKKPYSENFVLLEGPGFFEEAEWLWLDHHTFDAFPEDCEEECTLLVPNHVVASWSRRLRELPENGTVRRNFSGCYAALRNLLAQAESNPDVTLTVVCLA